MNGNPNISGMRQPPQPYQQPDVGEFRREVPDVSLVFNSDERSLVLPLLPSDRQQQQSLLHRSRSVPGRISDPALPPQPLHYRTPPPRPAQMTSGPLRPSPASTVPFRPSPASSAPPRPSPASSAPPWPSPSSSAPPRPSPASSVPPRPSPLTRPAPAALTDVSISYDDGREVPRAATTARRTSPVEPVAALPPRSVGSPGSSGGGQGSAGSLPPEPACCGAELRAVLRLVADNGRQLAQLRAQVRQLLSRDPAGETASPTRRVLLREAHTQTEGELPPRPATTATAVNTSFSLTPRRDVGTDPAPPPPPTPPAVERAAAAGRVSEVTGSGGRENTAQVQRRRVQEWVVGAGWTEQEQEPELTLRGLVLPTVPEQQPSPEASLHVEMQEYQPSPGGSADGSIVEENAELERPKPDRTFFQNVMGQVNQILDGAGRREPARAAEAAGGSPAPSAASPVPQHRQDEVVEAEPDPVRRATLQQLRAAGVSLAPSQPDDGSVLDYSCPPRAMRAAAAVPCSSDLSLEMNTLAMKYVDSRQLMQRAGAVGGRPAPHPVEARLLGKENLAPPTRGRPTDMTMYGISDSNMSFSSRKYMEKFNLQS